MACRFDPSILIGSELLGAKGGNVPQRIGEVVLVPICREQRLFGRPGISDSAGVHGGQGLFREPLPFHQGAWDLQVDLSRKRRIAKDLADDRGDLARRQLVEPEQRRRIWERPVGLPRVGQAARENGCGDAADDSIGEHHAAPSSTNGFSTKEHESERRLTSPRPTNRVSRLPRFSLSAS